VDPRRTTLAGLTRLSATLDGAPGVWAVSAGKAALGMALALDEAIGGRIVSGIATATARGRMARQWRSIAATHPEPSDLSEAAGRAALELADEARSRHGLLVVCLSGGASAMLAVPAPGLSIADKIATTRCLLRRGLDIGQINLVRRHLSAIKGGQLAARAERTVTLAISDVCTPVEDDPAVIGSGPTAGDGTTFEEALRLVRDNDLVRELPSSIVAHLEAGAAGRAAGPVPSDDWRLAGSTYSIVASRRDAMRAAAEAARSSGYEVIVEQAPITGVASEAARRFVAAARAAPRPVCLVASGETTVHVRGAGLGGRNQEFALAALQGLADLAPAALASVGTDGRDGPTDAAGAIVDDSMWRALGPSQGGRVQRALAANDSYPLLDALGALVRTGPTGTNVGDLQVLLLPQEAGNRVS
jgi:glycerate-2-kinase